jgi:hypothetical protein
MPGSVSSELSTKSKSETKQECPYCSEFYQSKSLFHHIRIHHPSQFLENTQKKWIAEAETGRPLKMVWESNIDEELGHSDMTVIYGCLATDKCFTTEERAMRHFKHNPADLKKHNLQLRKLKKEYDVKKSKEQKAKERNPAVFLLQKALRENDPKLLEGLWRGMNHWKKGCDLAVSLGNYRFELSTEFTIKTVSVLWSDMLNTYEKTCHKATKALKEDCKNSSLLMKLYNDFWIFLEQWKDAYRSVTELDPRFDYSSKECIVVKRDEDFMDEEYFFVATKEMPLPTLDDFAPETKASTLPSPSIDVLPLYEEKPLTKLEVFKKLPEKDREGLMEAIKPKPSFASHYSIPKPQQDFYLPKPTKQENNFPSVKIIQQTKRPPKQV